MTDSAPDDAPAPERVRVRLDLAYDGAAFHGWARQPGLSTVQESLESALEKIVRTPVRTVVAGRTDAGVHARGQVAHLDLDQQTWEGLSRGRAGLTPRASLLRRLGGVLSPWCGAITVHDAGLVPAAFDARFSALWREYSYLVSDDPGTRDPLRRGHVLWLPGPLNEASMVAEVVTVLGLHDFLSFCKPRPEATTIRELQDFTVRRREDGLIEFRLRADAFCHSMVRSLVAAVLRVGEGREAPGYTRSRLEAQVRDGHSRLAAPHPLVLERVAYPDYANDDAAALTARAEGTRARRL
ncbi:MAG: tRNA pseudouridine(38-40) synthase TruA [Micrococcus sp.]|nr:tRNA pseudouridine(38-40) synthase TruA [Micrococcus sp.]